MFISSVCRSPHLRHQTGTKDKPASPARLQGKPHFSVSGAQRRTMN